MNRRRIALGIAMGLLACLAAWLLLRPGAAPEVPREQVAMVEASPPAPRPRPRVTGEPAAEQPASAPRTVHEEALFVAARYSGRGVVRCRLPADLPAYDLERLSWGGVHEGVLAMAVKVPEGRTALRAAGGPQTSGVPEPDHPLAVLSWEGADPGRLGTCTVTRPERIPVTIRVLREDGEPAAGARVRWQGGKDTADHRGRVEVEVWRYLPLRVSSVDFGPFRAAVEHFAPDVPGEVLELQFQLPEAPAAGSSGLAGLRGFLEDGLAEERASLQQALDDEGLSEGARAQIEAWMHRRVESTDETHEMLDRAEGDIERIREDLEDTARD